MIIQPRIYLASQSPRRRELLKQIGVNFEMLLPRFDTRRDVDTDETPLTNELPDHYVQRICQAKANAGWKALKLRNLPSFPVLAADTSVILDGKIIGKPHNREQATDTLRALSGRQHQVLSAVAMVFEKRIEMRLSTSKITFAALSEERIRRYILTNEPLDKAGSYAIQGYAAAFIQHIEGSYSGVMGLPLFETVELLQVFGYPVL
ncbi:MAG: nucleoside triphosphate pyrophosphatase [Gallionellaceae bacterium]|nr:nucleoside triphosphate pyrophosphatase [Gallionellaceae bacterium]